MQWDRDPHTELIKGVLGTYVDLTMMLGLIPSNSYSKQALIISADSYRQLFMVSIFCRDDRGVGSQREF